MAEWWNGIHSRLKICRPLGLAGSTPASATMESLGEIGNLPCSICGKTGNTTSIIFSSKGSIMHCNEHTPEEIEATVKRVKSMHDYSGYGWIKVKRYVDDPSLSWEERYARLDAHHTKETTFLINKIRDLSKELNGQNTTN